MTLRLCTDAGHGGRDSGAVDGTANDAINSYEKVYTLDCATKFNAAMVRCGVATIMTRTGDTYPTLSERCTIANNFNANLFVSWHFDSAGYDGSSAKGISILYRSAAGAAVANPVYNNISLVSPWLDRGLKYRSDLAVLNGTHMPAIIIEGGFLTNTEEEKLIADPNYRTALAEAAARGVCSYYGIPYVSAGLYTTPNALYRFLRKDGKEHFYTMSADEAVTITSVRKTHIYEGIAWVADPAKNTVPALRFLNSLTGQHFYTHSESEIASIQKPGSPWCVEGTGFWVNTVSGTPAHRLVYPGNNDHLWTLSDTERNLAASRGGWVSEGDPFFIAV